MKNSNFPLLEFRSELTLNVLPIEGSMKDENLLFLNVSDVELIPRRLTLPPERQCTSAKWVTWVHVWCWPRTPCLPQKWKQLHSHFLKFRFEFSQYTPLHAESWKTLTVCQQSSHVSSPRTPCLPRIMKTLTFFPGRIKNSGNPRTLSDPLKMLHSHCLLDWV